MSRDKLPIEEGFPIEKVNDIARKEGYARLSYRPIYGVHKWWARRLGSVFRTICLYTLLDDPEDVDIYNGHKRTLHDFNIQDPTEDIDLTDPEALMDIYHRDVQIESDKKVLDPFMGGGTPIIEASRFGAETKGVDLNPVAWFISKKEVEASETDIEKFNEEVERIKEEVEEEIKQYYRTDCPECEEQADVMYYLWVKQVNCPSCENKVSLFNDYRIAEKNDKSVVYCPSCESINRTEDWKEETTCEHCSHTYVPQEGRSGNGKFSCGDCGQKYSIIDAIQEQDGFDLKMYGIEYYCPSCEAKDYKTPDSEDEETLEKAREEFRENKEELFDYLPNQEIPEGHMTSERNDVFRHGMSDWTDMFNNRQLLSLSKLLKSIDGTEDENIKEFLLLAFTNALDTNNLLTVYNPQGRKVERLFKSNSFDPPMKPVENNVWGTKYGRGTFTSTLDLVRDAIKWSSSPSEKYIEKGETKESSAFRKKTGMDANVVNGDAREIDAENEYDAVLTDPPYYDNIIYSEVSDFFFVWQRLILNYEGFEPEKTSRAESIVSNPAIGKDEEEFEDELGQAFDTAHTALKEDGVMVFTYHYAGVESWGELLQSLCDVGFEVTATYPITADVQELTKGESVNFDIVVVARPVSETEDIGWRELRRRIHATARETREDLENNRDLSQGDIGVIEMGSCFREYSKHHGKVHRDGEIMDAKEVVEEIYGIIQEASDIGATDVFLDLLAVENPSFDEANKLCRGSNTTPEELKEKKLIIRDGEFRLGTWNNEKRIAYLQNQDEDALSTLGKLQLLRDRYERGKKISHLLDDWISPNVRRLSTDLAEIKDDSAFQDLINMEGSDEPNRGQQDIEDY